MYNCYFLLDEVVPTPHGSLSLRKPGFKDHGAIYHVDNMLTHYDDFSYSNFLSTTKHKLLPTGVRKYVFTFTHMPLYTDLVLSHTAKLLIRNDPDTFLVIMSPLETTITDVALKETLTKEKIPLNKVIVLCSNIESHQKDLSGVRYIAIEFWESYSRHHHKMLDDISITYPDQYNPTQIKKKFLCLNRNVKPHRIWFYYCLQKSGIIESSYTSFHLPTVEPFEYNQLARHHNVLKYIPQDLHPEYKKYLQTRMHVRKLDKIDERFVINYNATMKAFYNKCAFSVVTESDHRNCFITEKTYKAIMNMHPFYIVGVPQQQQLMRAKGYETFEDLFPIQYVNDYKTGMQLLTLIEKMDLDVLKTKLAGEYRDKLVYNQHNFLNRKISWNTIVDEIQKATVERI